MRSRMRSGARSSTVSALAWSILGLLALALAAYWLPWIDHQSAALKLSGQDLGEFVKFLPQIRRGQMQFPRQVFYLPPFVAALLFVLLSTNRELGYPRWARIVALVLAVLALPGLLPPVWGHPRDLFNAEFRLQGIALVLGLVAILSHGLWKSLPLRLVGWTQSITAMLVLIPTQWAFWAIRPRIWQAYNTPTIHLGWGLLLEIVAWLGILGCGTTIIWKSRLHAD
jgi:hypothetical protein